MTTKRARNRRLVQSTEYAHGRKRATSTSCYAKSGGMTTATEHRIIDHPRHRWWSGRSEWSATLFGCANGSWSLYAPTRLALHDAILRAGWPSPWHEVGTVPTASFVADMQAAGWTTKLDTVFRPERLTGTAETTRDGVRITARVWMACVVVSCRADYHVGPIGYSTIIGTPEWVAVGAAFHTAELARKYRESAAQLLSKP